MVMTGGVITKSVSHEVISDWYDAWNERDWERVRCLLSPHFEFEDVANKICRSGRKSYLKYAKHFASAFPNGKIKVERILGSGKSGDWVVVEYLIRGHQHGEFAKYPAIGRSTEFKFCDVLKFENQKLVECRTYGDFLGPLSELGHIASDIEAKSREVA